MTDKIEQEVLKYDGPTIIKEHSSFEELSDEEEKKASQFYINFLLPLIKDINANEKWTTKMKIVQFNLGYKNLPDNLKNNFVLDFDMISVLFLKEKIINLIKSKEDHPENLSDDLAFIGYIKELNDLIGKKGVLEIISSVRENIRDRVITIAYGHQANSSNIGQKIA